jgi:hypothetical protein
MKDGNTILPEGMDDIINKVMEYKPKTYVPNIDDHVFNDNDKDDDYMGNENGNRDAIDVDGDGEQLLAVNPSLIDLVNKGWKKFDNMNIKKV